MVLNDVCLGSMCDYLEDVTFIFSFRAHMKLLKNHRQKIKSMVNIRCCFVLFF